MKLPKVILITTIGCPACGQLIKDLIPIAKTYKLQVRHLIAKRYTDKSGSDLGVLLYENGKRIGYLPEEYSQPEPRFPILIFESNPPLMVIGDKGAEHLKKVLEDSNQGKSLDDILTNISNSNIDDVVKEYESLPEGKVHGKIIEYSVNIKKDNINGKNRCCS